MAMLTVIHLGRLYEPVPAISSK